uniref:Uncharacterized protein n=1 Tax=Ditylenchus dipsaci TaxID=166011 RepID=A0A915CN87_9BILA
MDRKPEAMSYFCKQISLFSHVNDVEGKCETIQHILAEKQANNERESCFMLCQMRREIAGEEGNDCLQVDLLS